MLLLDSLQSIIPYLSNSSGVPEDQIFCIFVVLSGIPFSIINYSIKSPQTRLWYSLIIGMLLQFLIYTINLFHCFIIALVTYLFIQFYGRKRTSFWIFGFSMGYLALMHLYRYFTAYEEWSIKDPTSVVMMTIPKFSSLCFSYEDGDKEDKDIYNGYHRKNKVVNKPTLLEVMSYTFFYPTSTYGPSIEFKDFIDFIHLRNDYEDLNKSQVFRRNMLYGTLIIIEAFALIGVYGALNSTFSIAYLGNPSFGQESVLYRFVYINLSSFFTKAKYYGGWMLTYAICVYSGLSYTKASDGSIVYEKGDLGSIITVETGYNPRTIIMNWNRTVHLWLKYFLFLRLINVEHWFFKNNFKLSSLCIFICSAFWHGYYPCYYFFFISFFVFQQGTEIMTEVGLFDWLMKQNIIVKAIASIIVQFMINCLSDTFFALKWTIVKQFMINTYWMPIGNVIGFYIIARGLRFYYGKKPKKQ